MFDSGEVRELDAGAAAAAVAACHQGLVQQECGLLQLAAHWVTLHPAEAIPDDAPPGAERPWRLGGVGTPEVGEFAPDEFAALIGTSTTGAIHLMADAVDLRHRLPRLWARVGAAQVRSWRARQVAKATRHLDPAAAAAVDAAVAGVISELPWTRFETLLDGKIIEADPAGAEAAERLAAAQRFVRAGRANEHGLKLLVARAHAGEVIWFLAMVNRIADILHAEGDPDPVDVRRSKAIGILAQPALALQLLYDHRDDPDQVDGQTPPDDTADPDEREVEGGEPGDTQDPDQPQPDVAPPGAAPSPAQQPHDWPSGESTAPHRSVRLRRPLLDPAKARPPVTLHVHLSAEALTAGSGVCRAEDVGPITLSQLRRFLGDRCRVTLQPVVDLRAGLAPVDGYEVPSQMREHLYLRGPADVFPYGVNTRRGQELDHTIPYLPPNRGGPPGQTRLDNLGPLVKHHHRVKTHGRWRRRQPEAGVNVWRSPNGWYYLVTNTGTHPLGNGPFAHRIWEAASPSPNRKPRTSPLTDYVSAGIQAWPSITLRSPRHRPEAPLRR